MRVTFGSLMPTSIRDIYLSLSFNITSSFTSDEERPESGDEEEAEEEKDSEGIPLAEVRRKEQERETEDDKEEERDIRGRIVEVGRGPPERDRQMKGRREKQEAGLEVLGTNRQNKGFGKQRENCPQYQFHKGTAGT